MVFLNGRIVDIKYYVPGVQHSDSVFINLTK